MRDIIECEIKHRQFKVMYPLAYEYIVKFRKDVHKQVFHYLAKEKFNKNRQACSIIELSEIEEIIHHLELIDHIYMHMQIGGFGISNYELKQFGINWKEFYLKCIIDLSMEFREGLDNLLEENGMDSCKSFNYKEIAQGIRFCNLSKANEIDLLELFYIYFKIQLKFNQHDDVKNHNHSQLYEEITSDYKKLEKFSYKVTSSADSCFINEDVIKVFEEEKHLISLRLCYFDEPESVSKVIIEFLSMYLLRRANNNQDIVSDDQLALDLYKIKEHTAIAEVIDLLDSRLDRSSVRQYNTHLPAIISLICWDIEQANQPKSGGLCNKNNKKEPVHFKVMELITSILESKNESIKLERNESSGRISKITYKDKKGMQIDSADFKDLTTEFIADNIRKNFSNFKQTMNEGFLNRNIKTSKLRN